MTTTAEQCIARRRERTCHELIILSLPARLYMYVSQGGGRCVTPIVVLYLTVDDCTSHVYYIYSYDDDWV